uniref:Uncharacterized protein n=1 Tax=Anguilla anguilla TaxID=7936 RepID=A0A0E9SHY1_ANGAN
MLSTGAASLFLAPPSLEQKRGSYKLALPITWRVPFGMWSARMDKVFLNQC